MSITIEQVKPPVGYYHYSNERSQGALLRQTSKWPMRSPSMFGCSPYDWINEDAKRRSTGRSQKSCVLPSGYGIGDAYIDRMQGWDREKYLKFVDDLLSGSEDRCSLNQLLRQCPEENLIKAAANYFGKPVVSVRVVYYYNCATGYDCQRIDCIYAADEQS